jgi:tRNA A-37 threonylcarbamoyl transferase component Bud32
LTLHRLSAEEKNALLEVADDVVGGEGKTTAVAAYGSKIAGYARDDSDYDLLVVAKKFRGRVRYNYVDSPVPASALVVEESLLESDAMKAYLGEFVSGRLLNVYEPILSEEIFRKAELESKKRVLAEEILEIASQHGEFAQDLVIPLDYFLFNKLHKRALIYPPALYSYVKTYTCPLKDENKAFTLEGFAEAALSLQASGVLKIGISDKGASVRILGEGLKSRAFASILSLFNLTARGMRQYAVHGFAGRVGINVFKDEALSKVKRMQEKVDPPLELEEPKRLIGLEEGFLLPKTVQMIERLATLSGMVAYTTRNTNLGEVYSTAKLVTLRSGTGNEEVKYVFKYFADIRSMKWALLNVWSLSRKFSMSPQARMHREYNASLVLREKGVATPTIVGGALDDKVLVKEFIEGERLSDIVQEIQNGKSEATETVRRFGQSMGIIHNTGFAVGDSKANNVIVRSDATSKGPENADLYFTDLEQATEGGDQAWDVAEFVYYQAKLSFKDSGARKVADAFLEGYRETNGVENIVKAMTSKYVAPFRPFSTPQVLKAVKESLDSHSN